MNLAEQHLQEGRLQEALAELQNQVRKDPANPKLRTFLFQLLAVLGEWDRALTQLNVAGELDAANLAHGADLQGSHSMRGVAQGNFLRP